METYITKGSGCQTEVKAGQWKKLGDLEELDLVGDGGESRAIKITEEGEVLVRVSYGQWVVMVNEGEEKGDYAVLSDDKFHEHYIRSIHATLSMSASTTSPATGPDRSDGRMNMPTNFQKNQFEKENKVE